MPATFDASDVVAIDDHLFELLSKPTDIFKTFR